MLSNFIGLYRTFEGEKLKGMAYYDIFQELITNEGFEEIDEDKVHGHMLQSLTSSECI